MGESRRKAQRRKSVSASRELSRDLVFASDAPVQRKFKQQLGAEIESFVEAAYITHTDIEATLANWPKNERAQYARIYLHVALNSLYCSVHFLVSGYMGPAGHQLRLFAEAIAMSMLMLIDKEWKDFRDRQDRYPADDALSRVLKRENRTLLEQKLSLDVEAWRALMKLTRLYSHHSHAGAVSLAMSVKIEWPRPTILGGEYDPGKKTEYRADLKRAASGAAVLQSLVRAIDRVAQEIG